MTDDATRSHTAIGPKPWRCELCGATSGLVENDGRIECFTIPTCKARRGRMTPDCAAILNAEEREAGDHLLAFMEIVSQRWGLAANAGEMTTAIHTLQGFIIQHMLVRIAPDHWGDWWAS